MREQRITIRLVSPSGNPDADVALRTATAILHILESLDKKSWQVGKTRYDWEISKASKQSPMLMEYHAVPRKPEFVTSSNSDVVGRMLETLHEVDQAKPKTPRYIDVRDLTNLAEIGNGKKNRELDVEVAIPTQSGIGEEKFAVSARLRRHATMLKLQLEDKFELTKPEYVVVEGLLTMIEADPRQAKKRYTLGLVERGTGRGIKCHFPPTDSATLGAHVGHNVFVEGDLGVDGEGKTWLDVIAFRLIPKKPLTEAELREYGISPPVGMDAEEYIRMLRADDD